MSTFDPSEAPLLGYIAKFKDGAHEGPVTQLYFEDTEDGRRKAEEAARQMDESGHSVYACIGRLRCKPRNKDNVAELDRVVQDIDLRNVVETREQVLEVLRGLPLQPYEIRDSGGGLHVDWRLREPLVDDAGMAQAEAVMKQMTWLLAADPAPTHRAALLRVPGTHNYRYGGKRECCVIERNGSECDISEFDDLLDLYGDAQLLHYKEKPVRAGNGSGGDLPFRDSEGRLDVGAALAGMQPTGASANDIQPSVILSLLQKAIHPDDVLSQVVDSTMETANAAKLGWTREKESRDVLERCKSGVNKLNREYDLISGTVPSWLAGDFHPEWIEALRIGRRPGLYHSTHIGWHVRSYGAKGEKATAPASAEQPPFEAASAEEQKPQAPPPKGRIYPRPFACFDFTKIPQREWLYGGHYMRSIASATIGPGGSGKSSLDLVESIAMATARNLLGEQPTERLRVWYHNGEDPLAELERRIAAVCVYYKIDPRELDGYFFCTSGLDMPIKIAGGNGEVKLNHATAGAIIDGIRTREIDVLILDPLITLHSLAEAENHKMDPVLREFARIANDTNCAIELAHHTRKKVSGQEDYTTADARGATAIIDAVRSARTLNGLNDGDAKRLGIDDDLERLSYFRVDKGKANMTRRSAASYYRLVGQELPNGLAGGPGDDVGVVTRTIPPDVAIELTQADIAVLVAETANSDQAEKVQSENWFGHTVARHFKLDTDSMLDRVKVETVIAALVRGKHIRCVSRKGRNKFDRHRRNMYVPTKE
jgi:hypothetical protein